MERPSVRKGMLMIHTTARMKLEIIMQVKEAHQKRADAVWSCDAVLCEA